MSAHSRAVRLGLTGGIGSGKSTVGSMLAAAGAALIDADAISRATTAANGAAMADILRHFGPAFVMDDGALHRARMREHVFATPAARQQLEAIVHPHVQAGIARAAAQAAAAGAPLIVFDIPLLVESGRWASQLDAVLVVDCRVETQIARVQQRSGLAHDAVQAIIQAQASRAARRAAADAVLLNDGIDLDALHAQTQRVGTWFGL